MRKLFDDHLTGLITKKIVPSCFLCGAKENLTKEHVLPKWIFNSQGHHVFVTDINQLPQRLIRATIPACGRCNSELLNGLERYIQRTLSTVDLKRRFYTDEELSNIIRWLEILDFKFQVWDIMTPFRAHKTAGYVEALADISIAFMRDLSVRLVTSKARLALRRIATRDKYKRHNSLILASMKEPTSHHFHKSGHFIYLEVPLYRKAFFYFFEETFIDDRKAKRKAMKIIRSVYKV